MSFVSQYIDKFAELFSGNKEHYGYHIPDKTPPKEGEKAKGKTGTKHGEVTKELYFKHLHGEQSLGIIPIDSNSNIRFGAIDIDKYPVDQKFYIHLILRIGVPLIPFRSKSGGLHLYLFFSEDTPAAKARPQLQRIRHLLGLPKETEVFPKQTKLLGNAVGNFINLPYFDQANTVRYAYDSQGKQLKLPNAIDMAYDNRVTLRQLIGKLDELDLADGPPCLQTIYMSSGSLENERNIFLFNVAVYLKAKFGEDFAEHLHLLNEQLADPLPRQELESTIITSHSKRTYTFQCNDGILSQYCDRTDCRQRENGIDSSSISDLSLGELKHIKGTESYYIWNVNNQDMHFYSTKEIINQEKFREQCFEQLHFYPKRLKDNKWVKMLNDALENVVVERVSDEDEMTLTSLLNAKVMEFLQRQQAMRPAQIEDGLVYYDVKTDRLWFKSSILLNFLFESRLFNNFKTSQLRDAVKKLGAVETDRLHIGGSKTVRGWFFRVKKLQREGYLINFDLKEGDAQDFEPLDFTEEEEF